MLLVTMSLCNPVARHSSRIESGEPTLNISKQNRADPSVDLEFLLLLRMLQAEKRGYRPVATKLPCLMSRESLDDDGGDQAHTIFHNMKHLVGDRLVCMLHGYPAGEDQIVLDLGLLRWDDPYSVLMILHSGSINIKLSVYSAREQDSADRR